MDYTLSNSFLVDPNTGFRRHLQAQAVPTQVTDQDMNSVLWSCMEVLKAAGVGGQAFDPAVPASYQKLRDAINRRTCAGLFGVGSGTINLTPEMAGTLSIEASSGNVVINLPLSHACAPANVSQEFFFIRRDSTQNTVTINCTGSDLLDDAATSFTLDGPGRYRGVRSSGPLLRWFTCSKSDDLTGIQFYTTFSTPPAGAIKANGALLLRSQFPTLFRFANAQGLVSEATWTATSSGRYSVGDGSTTFRIPDDRGEFIRGADDGRGVDPGRAIGTWQSDAIRNITGSISQIAFVTTSVASGALSLVGNGTHNGAASGISSLNNVSFNASNQVPTALENRSRNLAKLSCIWI